MSVHPALAGFFCCAIGASAMPAGEDGPDLGYRVFHIGNSFTVNTHFHPEYFAQLAGWTAHDHLCAWAPGMQIGGDWGHWKRPEASAASETGDHLCGWKKGLQERTWDRILIQPFFEDPAACITAANALIDYSVAARSPDLQAIVKQIWYFRDDASFEASRQPNGVAYTESIADGIAATHPGMEVRICPSGLVIQELRRLTTLGKIPGVTREAEWYVDNIHLSRLGDYADGMAQFITLYGTNPNTFGFPPAIAPTQWYGYHIPAETARAIIAVAWAVTSSYPRSGVVAATDDTPPSTPAGVRATRIGSGGFDLEWQAATDRESGIAAYAVLIDGVRLTSSFPSPMAKVVDLSPGSTCRVNVVAYNRAGLASAASLPFQIETTLPTTPLRRLSLQRQDVSLHIANSVRVAANLTPSQADNPGIRWTTSAPDIAVVESGLITGKMAGTAVITATPCDRTGGAQSASVSVTVLPNRPPCASFTVESAKKGGPLSIACNGSESKDPDPKDSIFGWDWDFGDGSPRFHGSNPVHAYAKPGNYIITLVVKDCNGTCSNAATRSVIVPVQ